MAKVTTIKKAAKKKKMSKQDEKQIKDFEEREKAEKGYDEDARRYGMKESVFDARPKQKTEVEVMARTGHKGTQYSHEMRGRRLGPENPVNREFARIRIGDTELAKKEAAAKMRGKISEAFQISESKIADKIKSHPGVEYYGGKDDYHFIHLKPGYWNPGLQETSFSNETAKEAEKELKDVRKMTPDEVDDYYHYYNKDEREQVKASLKEELVKILEARKSGAKPKDDNGPCWSGYTQYGMKTKRGRSVPNCVKDK